jgi:hypothetical protein
VTQLTDDCMEQLTRTRWHITLISIIECPNISRSLLWNIDYSCSLYIYIYIVNHSLFEFGMVWTSVE